MYVEFEPGMKYAKSMNEISEDHNSFRDAGWVLTDDDYVVDIDSLPKDTIKKLLISFNICTQIVWTERGCHLYFKKPANFRQGANRISPLGFPYEIKHSKNTKAVTIKRDGILRNIENEGIRENPPFIFDSNKKYDNLLGLDEGEGRNNKLFSLRSQLGGQRDWRKILIFVNENIFASPLEDNEMEAITRDMHVEADKDNQYDVATWLMNSLHFIEYGQRYYFKHNGEFTHRENILERKVFETVGDKKTTYVNEVIEQMKMRCKIIPNDTVFDIKFKNGYLRDGEFVDLITEDFSPYNIDIEYDPNAEAVEMVDDYINKLTSNDKCYRDLLLEVLGHTLIVNPEFKRLLARFFIFIGDGGNGKGTLLTIIRTILDSKNVTGMGISELTDERYLSSFKGMLANLGDDLQDQPINDKQMKILKNISTSDFIATRELYKTAENMYFTGSLIFTSNHILKSWEKGESYKRRVLWLPMYTKVDKKDPLFITKLTTEKALKYWMRLIVEGYKRLYKNHKFTESETVNSFNDRYHRENNPALDYVEFMEAKDFDKKPIRDVYDDYETWCEDNAIDNFSKRMLSDVLLTKFNLEKKGIKINGKNTKCFAVKDD